MHNFFVINVAKTPACLNTIITTVSMAVAVDSAAETGPGVWRMGGYGVPHFPPGNRENCPFGIAMAELISLLGCQRALELCRTIGGMVIAEQ